jgi:hypothetical protein
VTILWGCEKRPPLRSVGGAWSAEGAATANGKTFAGPTLGARGDPTITQVKRGHSFHPGGKKSPKNDLGRRRQAEKGRNAVSKEPTLMDRLVFRSDGCGGPGSGGSTQGKADREQADGALRPVLDVHLPQHLMRAETGAPATVKS